MAKAGIITFLHNTNYGSLLQAFALEKVLETLNVEAIHLDYCPDVPEKVRNIIRSRNSPALLLEGIRKRQIRQGREVLAKKSRALTDFRKNYLRLSEKLPDIRFRQLNPVHDKRRLHGYKRIKSAKRRLFISKLNLHGNGTVMPLPPFGYYANNSAFFYLRHGF